MTYLIVMTRVCLNPIFLKKLLAWRVLFRMGSEVPELAGIHLADWVSRHAHSDSAPGSRVTCQIVQALLWHLLAGAQNQRVLHANVQHS